MNQPSLEPSAEVIAGRYRIERTLGAGGMGTVYLAFDATLQRLVALKTLRPHAERTSSDELVRFRREATLPAAIAHPNVARVYDAGEHAGTLFVVMEYIPGANLHATLALGSGISFNDRIRWLFELAAALAEVHRHGIIHRDVKPSNVIVAPSGTVHLVDFGIAKNDPRGAAMDTQVTGTGVAIGTPAYMAPELLQGEPATFASDQYAWGCVAYECFAEGRGFSRPPLAELGNLPPQLALLIDRARAPLAAMRWPSMDHLVAALMPVAMQFVSGVVPAGGRMPAHDAVAPTGKLTPNVPPTSVHTFRPMMPAVVSPAPMMASSPLAPANMGAQHASIAPARMPAAHSMPPASPHIAPAHAASAVVAPFTGTKPRPLAVAIIATAATVTVVAAIGAAAYARHRLKSSQAAVTPTTPTASTPVPEAATAPTSPPTAATTNPRAAGAAPASAPATRPIPGAPSAAPSGSMPRPSPSAVEPVPSAPAVPTAPFAVGRATGIGPTRASGYRVNKEDDIAQARPAEAAVRACVQRSPFNCIPAAGKVNAYLKVSSATGRVLSAQTAIYGCRDKADGPVLEAERDRAASAINSCARPALQALTFSPLGGNAADEMSVELNYTVLK